jgi:hypothetical protein
MLLPFDALLASTFPNNLPLANWFGGSPNFNLFGVGTSISSNRLLGSASILANRNIGINVGTLVFKVKVPYNTAPLANKTVFMIAGAVFQDFSFEAFHVTDSTLVIQVGAGGNYPAGAFGGIPWVTVAGREYELKLTWDYITTKRIRMFLGEVNSGIGDLIFDQDTTLTVPTLTPNPLVDTVSFGRNNLSNTNYAGYEFYDVLMYDYVLNPTDTQYVIKENSIPAIIPPLALPTSVVYGRFLYNNTPVSGGVITFKPDSVSIYNGDISLFEYPTISDANGYFEIVLPYGGAGFPVNYTYSYTPPGVPTISGEGVISVPLAGYLIIS